MICKKETLWICIISMTAGSFMNQLFKEAPNYQVAIERSFFLIAGMIVFWFATKWIQD